jgi:hypothetical protein
MDFADGARYICEELQDYVASTLTDVRVIAYSDDEFETLESVATSVQSG